MAGGSIIRIVYVKFDLGVGNTITSFIPGTTISNWVEVEIGSGLIEKEGQVVSFSITSTESDSYSYNSKDISTSYLRPILVITTN